MPKRTMEQLEDELGRANRFAIGYKDERDALRARVAELEAEQNRLLMMTVDPVGVAFQRKCERKDILAIVRAVEEEADLDTEHGVGWSQACRSIDNRISRL